MGKKPRIRMIAGAILLLVTLAAAIRSSEQLLPVFSALMSRAGSLSALAVLPEGGANRLRADFDAVLWGTSSAPALSAGNPSPASSGGSSVSSKPLSSVSPSSAAASSMPSQAPPPSSGTVGGKVLTKFFDKSGANLIYQNIYVKNNTSGTVDLKKELGTRPNVTIKKNAGPMVLILHTHATEAFLPYDHGYYLKETPARTTDTAQNICAVGAEIAKHLNAAGISTLHDKTLHDHPSYSGGYERSAATIKSYLKKHPSLQVILDIHRDAITYDNGDKVKPTAEIGGKKAAQIMICAGRQDGKVTEFPNWRQNFRFALRIQQACETEYPGLARPIYFVSKRYNEYLLPGSLLIEMGSEGNTLSEAIYSAELLSKALIKVLDTLQ